MKEIQLSKQGHKRKGQQVALVDDEDFDRINQWRWHVSSTGYAVRKDRSAFKKTIFMHRVILNNPDGIIDHENHNTLDNQKLNLRECTNDQNMMNKKRYKNNTSGYKGVVFDPGRKSWRTQIQGTTIGRFDSKIEAAEAYDRKAKEIFGQFAKLNFSEA